MSPSPRLDQMPHGQLGQRGAKACERCWKRKQKCDRLFPSCTSCTEVGEECFARDRNVDILSDVSGLTHLSINSYVTTLKQRIAEDEKLGDSCASPPRKRARTESSNHHNVSSLATFTGITSPGFARANNMTVASMVNPDTQEEQEGEDSSVRETMGAIGLLSNSAMAEPTSGAGEVRLAQAQVVNAALTVAGYDPSAALPAEPQLVLDGHQVPLQKDTIAPHLKRFAECSIFVSYLDETRLWNDLDLVVSHANGRVGGVSSPVPSISRFNVYMAAAIGMAMSNDAPHLSFLATSFHAAAAKLLSQVYHPTQALHGLHCTTMLLLYSLFSPSGGSAWHLLDLAMKTCISLGLHKEATLPSEAQEREAYDPKWLFWTLYFFDRLLSLAMDRPFSIQDSSITVQIPCEEGEGSALEGSDTQRQKSASCRHLIRYAQLMSSIRENYENPMHSYSNLCFWNDSTVGLQMMSIDTKSPTESIGQFSCRALMHIVQPVQVVHNTSGPLRGAAMDVETDTIDACVRLISRTYDYSGSGRPLGSFLDAYDILSSAIILVCLSRRLGRDNNPEHFAQMLDSMNKASAIIADIAAHFHAFRAFQNILIKLSARVMEERSGCSQQSFRNTFNEMPTTVPRRLRHFIQNSFT